MCVCVCVCVWGGGGGGGGWQDETVPPWSLSPQLAGADVSVPPPPPRWRPDFSWPAVRPVSYSLNLRRNRARALLQLRAAAAGVRGAGPTTGYFVRSSP